MEKVITYLKISGTVLKEKNKYSRRKIVVKNKPAWKFYGYNILGS